MIYIFELFRVERDGSRSLLETAKHRIKSKDLAHAHGQAMMSNFLFNGRRATTCAIKDQAGGLIAEVHAEARENA
jgi:hypothetical protein